MRTWVIGEMANEKSKPNKPLLTLDQLIEKGAFVSGSSRQILTKLGLTWNLSLNLSEPGEWDSYRIICIVRELLRERFQDGDRVFLCGLRVAKAFGVPFVPGYKTLYCQRDRKVTLTVLPHPSPRNRMWNNPDIWTTCKEAVK